VGVFADYAMKYWEAGYSVIPVNGKATYSDGWSKYCEEMPSLEQIEKWEKEFPNHNIGICLGPASNIEAVDFDMHYGAYEEIGNFLSSYLPDTPLVKKGRKGWTRFYKYSGRPSKCWNKDNQRMVDFLSKGRQTVVPPSIHPETGAKYTWLAADAIDINIVDLPTVPAGFFDICEQLAGKDYKQVLNMKEGRHDKIIGYGFATIESHENFDDFVKSLIEYDKKINEFNQYFLDKKYFKSKSQMDAAKEIAKKVEKCVMRSKEKKHGIVGWKVGKLIPITDIDMAIEMTTGFCDVIIEEKTNKVIKVPDYTGLANYLHANQVYRCTPGVDLVFRGGFWQAIGEKEKHNLILKLNKMINVPSHFRNYVTSMDARCFDPDYNRAHAGFINVGNGIFNIEKDEIIPHSPKFNFRYKSNVIYDKSAKTDDWNKFLNEIMDGDFERMACLQQMVGYILLGGEPFLQKAFVLLGEGRNGKSVFLKVLKELLGRDACSFLSLRSFSEKFETVSLDGKIANISSDEGDDFKVSTGAFKLAVAGEPLVVQQKGKPAYTIDVNARFIFSCNRMPFFGDRSHALMDRLIIIPFNRTFSEQEKDPFIDKKLIKELPGILNWAIDGAKEVLKNKAILIARESVASKEEMIEDTDPLSVWVDENLELVGVENSELGRSLYEHYKECMREDNNKPLTRISFCRELRKLVRQRYSKANGGKIPKGLEKQERSGTERRIIGVKFSDAKRKLYALPSHL